MWRKVLPTVGLTIAAMIIGFINGLLWRSPPSPPEVTTKLAEHNETKKDERKQAESSQSSSIFVVSPASVSTRKIKRYHPPAPAAACVAPGQPCVCPTPALAEEEEVTTNTGPGTVAANTQANSSSKQSSSEQNKTDKTAETHSRPVEKNWHVSLMPGMSYKDPPVDIPGLPHAVIGGNVERKVLSIGNVDVSAGLWGSSVGAWGLSLGGSF